MANITAARYKHERPTPNKFNDGVKADEVIYCGAGLLIDGNGYLVNAASGVSGVSRGVAFETKDATGLASGAITCEVRSGMFEFDILDSSPVDNGDCEQIVYYEDNHTIAASSNSGVRPVAGRLKLVTSAGKAVVAIGPMFPAEVGTLVAANNLSDVSSAATARANLGANTIAFTFRVADLKNANTQGFVSPLAFTITSIRSVLLDHALATGDASLTGKIGSTPITGGAITITQSGSAIGDKNSASPSAANVVAAGDFVGVTVGGTNSDTAASAVVTVYGTY